MHHQYGLHSIMQDSTVLQALFRLSQIHRVGNRTPCRTTIVSKNTKNSSNNSNNNCSNNNGNNNGSYSGKNNPNLTKNNPPIVTARVIKSGRSNNNSEPRFLRNCSK